MKEPILCVQWPRLGPYHLARLRALDAACRDNGMRLVALETAAQDEMYDWALETQETRFERVQVFRDRTFEKIQPDEMHRGVQEALDRIDPDVVAIHTYSFPDSRACLDWCVTRRRGSICMTDSKADDAPRSPLREWLKSHLVRAYDAALLAGSRSQAYFASLGFPEEAIFLGYDAVDNDFFAQRSRDARSNANSLGHLPGLDDPTPFFLACNRFIRCKNLTTLLKAYARYRDSLEEPWRLVMVGDGPLRDELVSLADRLELEGVTWAGFRQIDDLPSYYGLASCFVHPADKDTWGLVVNEAMAAGLPVIVSTSAGCYVDLVKDGVNGFSFDPNDDATLAQLMERVARDEKFRIDAGQASKDIVRQWSPERFAESMLDAFAIAQQRQGRGMHPTAKLMIAALRKSRSVTAFHSAEA